LARLLSSKKASVARAGDAAAFNRVRTCAGASPSSMASRRSTPADDSPNRANADTSVDSVSLNKIGEQFASQLKGRLQEFLEPDAVRHLIAGATAGVISTTAMAPLEVLRINRMVSKEATGVRRLAREIWAQGGLSEFWRGNTADVIRTIPASALRFCSFAVYKEKLPECFAKIGVHAPAVTSLFAGGFAGMTSMAVLFPLETVRTQMAACGALQGMGMMAFSRNLLASQGACAFYRGLPASLISVMPFFAVRFGVYDILKRWHMHLSESENLPAEFGAVYGFASSIAATALTFPMEMVRRRAMVGEASSNLFKVVPAIAKAEGFFGLYKGYGLNVMKVAPSSALQFMVYEVVRQGLDSFVDEPKQEVTPSQ